MHSPHLSWAPILFPLEYNFVSFSHGDTLVSSLIREMLKKTLVWARHPPTLMYQTKKFLLRQLKSMSNALKCQTKSNKPKGLKAAQNTNTKKQEKGEKCVGGLDAHTPSEWAGAGLVALCKLRSVNLSIRLQDCHQLELYLSRLRNIFLQID